MSAQLLLVEDEIGLRDLLEEELDGAGYRVRCASSVEDARELLAHWTPDLVISDLRLPGEQGLGLIPALQQMEFRPAILIITAFGSIQQAVEALKAGADDFLTKPLDIDHLLLSVARLLETRELRDSVKRYRSALEVQSFEGILGQSQPMQRLYHEIRSIASADGPVLIVGESGTGKELVARALHSLSDRKDGPYLAVNCGGIPADLIESEFFGHRAGAFTGAGKARDGLFQRADGGTLLLDEIGEMPLALQAKLLRVLQDGRIRPVGSDTEVQLDVRVFAATNRKLAAMVQDNSFREDLFFRLETFAIEVPSLRQRGEDIELLAQHFLTRFAVRKQSHVRGFNDETLELLRGYHFPGNVRELENAVERAVTFCDGRLIEPGHLPNRMLEAVVRSPAPDRVAAAPRHQDCQPDTGTLAKLEDVQSAHVHRVLQSVQGNKRKAAEILGITRRTLYRWLDK